MSSCCFRCNRYRLHLSVYGFVSIVLIVFGIIVSGFALFKQGSHLAKMWLAGPTTIAVGMVLCGKVVIDWSPAALEDDEDEQNGIVGHGVWQETDGFNSLPNSRSMEKSLVNSIDIQYMKTKDDGSLLLENLTTTREQQVGIYSLKPVYQSNGGSHDDRTPSTSSDVWNPQSEHVLYPDVVVTTTDDEERRQHSCVCPSNNNNNGTRSSLNAPPTTHHTHSLTNDNNATPIHCTHPAKVVFTDALPSPSIAAESQQRNGSPVGKRLASKDRQPDNTVHYQKQTSELALASGEYNTSVHNPNRICERQTSTGGDSNTAVYYQSRTSVHQAFEGGAAAGGRQQSVTFATPPRVRNLATYSPRLTATATGCSPAKALGKTVSGQPEQGVNSLGARSAANTSNSIVSSPGGAQRCTGNHRSSRSDTRQNVDASQLYQGVTFVLRDRQYFM